MRRWMGSLGLALVMACSAPATDPGPARSPQVLADDTPVDGDTLFVTIGLDPDNINPLVAPYALSGMVTELVTPGLARRVVGEEGLSYEPALASSWAWGDDGLSLTYTLRPDIRWSDGSPVTSADVAFTHELMADPEVASNWLGDAKHIVGVDALDERTVRFRFDGPRNPLLQQGLTFRGILPKHVFQDVDRASLRSHPASRQPPASGPFRVAEWKPNERLILERNPTAPADWRSHLDRIVLRVQPEPNTRRMALLKGEADLDMTVELKQLDLFKKNQDLVVSVQPAAAMMYLSYNLSQPRFQDVRVRKALTLATNRQALIDRVFTFDGVTYARPCTGTVGPTLGRWYNESVQPLPFDPAQAAALLDEAGWTDSDQDGVRDKGGEPMRINVMMQTGSEYLRDSLVLVQDQWKQVGVQLDIEAMDPTLFAERARRHDFDGMLWLFGSNPKVDPSIIWSTGEPYNWFQYSNPEVDRLLAEGAASVDITVAQDRIRQAQALIHDDQPVTFLVWFDGAGVQHKRFRDTQYNAFTNLLHAEQWWVPKAEQKYP